jgi:small subunit ribosomal protein S2
MEQVIPTIDGLMAEDESLQSPDYFQVHNLFTVKDLFEARVHLGHKIGSMNENMRPFIFGSRFDQVIFDLDKTAFHLRQALNFVAHVAYRTGIILFVTRTPQTMYLVEKTAIECGEYSHTKKWETTILADSRTKFGGTTRLPDALVMLSALDPMLSAHDAVKDAAKMLIPTVAIVDSNCNPNLVTFPIPGNDDTPCAVEFYCKLFKESILRGKQKRKINESRKQHRIGSDGDGTPTTS